MKVKIISEAKCDMIYLPPIGQYVDMERIMKGKMFKEAVGFVEVANEGEFKALKALGESLDAGKEKEDKKEGFKVVKA